MNEPHFERPFRLAFRVEGTMVNCYLALMDTMDGATYLGGISKAVLDVNPEQFAAFKTIMRVGLAAAIKESLGIDAHHFEETKAPEHERGGNA